MSGAGGFTTTVRAGARIVSGMHESVGVVRTLHAVPFVILGGALAEVGWPGWGTAALLLACVVFGRATLVGALRFFDAPRDIVDLGPTDPGVPPQEQTPRPMWLVFALHGAIMLVFLAWMLNPLTGWLAVAYSALLFLYAGLRRYTGLSHFMLGAGLGASPAAAWVALRGDFVGAWPGLVLLGGSLTLWVASFDMVFSLQPSLRGPGPHRFAPRMRLSERAVLRLARGCAVIALGGLTASGIALRLGIAFLLGVAGVAVLLGLAHRNIAVKGHRRIPVAFVRLNLLVGPTLLAATLVARALQT